MCQGGDKADGSCESGATAAQWAQIRLIQNIKLESYLEIGSASVLVFM